ncbi:erythromycin esterase family protein [Nocardiopsis sp. YSL2]|uniref:erythromycin esterase family protein n=1 Tax=Nocardiopsis sp. YSL2 TaxID=2939492 RepID=UPI0026F47061|nr:erythromycin esterase family protein [Nocardiopsis sp. YSL2]
MPASSHHDPFASELRGSTVPLIHLDPEAPLDDLEPLRDIVEGARVVAVGEHSHSIDEFARMRRRLLRFLVERCGFTVLAFEHGFSEGFALDAWAQGEGADDDLADHLAGTAPVGVGGPLRWIRRYNRSAAPPVRFAGVDLPAAGGSLLPALEPVAEYLRQVDPENVPAVETAMRIAASFAADSGAAAAPAWARLATADQDALSAILSRLLIRFRSVEPLYVARSDQHGYDVALRRLEGACQADYTFHAMADLLTGQGLTADNSARDAYMAESLLWHLERGEPEARVVLVAHNAHIQKAPVSFEGRLTAFPMGQHLHRALGDEYFALGLTSTTGHTAELRRDDNARSGFALDAAELGPPEPGSVEAAIADAELGLGIADLRRARARDRGGDISDTGPDRIRLQGEYLQIPVLDAFDGILNTPLSTVAGGLGGR